MGELFHTIEDSFAHNIRYLENGVIKIGAVLSMDSATQGEFKHDEFFLTGNGVFHWKCENVDEKDNFNWSVERNKEFPLVFEAEENDFYFTYFLGKKFVNQDSASPMAVHAISEFLWRLGEAVNDPNNLDKTELSIEEYLARWFMDGTNIFQPEKFLPLNPVYDEIFVKARWDNFYNVDLWVESGVKDITENSSAAALLPWVSESHLVDFIIPSAQVETNRRFVVDAIETDPNNPYYIANGYIEYDSENSIMHLLNNVLYVFTSWSEFDNFFDEDIQEFVINPQNFFVNGNAVELSIEELPELPESTAAIFIPRGFRVCLEFESDDIYDWQGLSHWQNNDAAKFFRMPTYRCFYGGKEGRLIAGGKEDALKPGTKIKLLPVDPDGDGIFNLEGNLNNDNCPFTYNPNQEDLDGDKIGDLCDPDIDDDGIDNERDYCPRIYSPANIDKDGDFVGDACDACPYDKDELPGTPVANYKPRFVTEGFLPGMPAPLEVQYYPGTNKPIDTDRDGVPDVCDNCKEVQNPRVIQLNPFHEIFLAPCEESADPEICIGEGGASFMEKTRNGGKVYTWGSDIVVPSINWDRKWLLFKEMKILGTYYAWQPDNDLDGIGDVCDYKGGHGLDNESENPGTSTARVMKIEGEHRDLSLSSNRGPFRINSLYKLELLAAKWTEANSDPDSTELKNTVHFCGVPEEEYNDLEGKIRWGQTGVCTAGTAKVEADFVSVVSCPTIVGGSGCTLEYSNYKIAPFGYSHGTDPAQDRMFSEDAKPWTHIAWGPTPDSAEKITKENVVIKRNPINAMKNWQFSTDVCVNALENSGIGCRIYPYWNWRVDALKYIDCDDEYNGTHYALCGQLDNNSAHNLDEAAIFHYSISAGAKGVSDTHILDENGTKIINPEYFQNVRKYARSFRTNLSDLHAQTYTPQIFSDFPPNNNQDYAIPVFRNYHFSDIPYETKRIEYWLAGESKFRKTVKSLPDNFIAMTSGEAGTLYSIVSEQNRIQALYVNYSEETHDWQRVFTIPNLPPELEVLGMDIIDTTMFVAGIDKEIYPAPLRIYKYDLRPNKMTSSVYHEFAEPMSQIKFIKTGDELMLTGINIDSLKVYILESDKIIERAILPLRIGYAVETNGKDLFIAGGFDSNNTVINNVIVSKDLGKTWNVLADFSNQPIDISTSLTYLSGEKMFIINPSADKESSIKKVASIDTITGETAITRMIPEGVSIEISSEMCVYENSGSIFPGSIGYDGDCLPVYDYNYETVSYFDYKYTVAGYANSIYLGGLTGVRRVEVKEDGTLSNKEMLYTGETNNLAVYGNTMYGANYGEIDIYAIAENGSVSRVKGISSSSCGNVRVSDDRLFTAENKRVRIFDISNPQSPVLIKTIATSGKVIDLEVVNDKLYIYEETTSWFTTKGFTGIYDIVNINSPVRTKYFEKRCTDAEMQKSGEAVYLGCKNGQLKVTDSGLVTVKGEKNYVREGYVFEGNLYQVFSGSLHMSKTASVASVCGDGIIENGEVCDGNIVECSSIDSGYISGIAACNSTCDGYNTSVCESDGW